MSPFHMPRFLAQLTLIILTFLLLPTALFAAASIWQIVPNESNLGFTGVQNDAPLSGQFKKFSGEINFDPSQLQNSHIKIIIDMSSVSFSYKDIENTLKSKDWFDVKVFPEAIFESSDFIKLSEDHYQAKGSLTIRNKTVPLIVDFTKESYADDKVKVKGYAMLKRTMFDIGKGEWASTDDVRDEVKVNFVLTAVKK